MTALDKLKRLAHNPRFGMSDEARFQLAYDGPGLQGGSMDVYALAPALLAVGDLLRDSNRFFNQDRSAVTIQVESDFRRGSFDISLLVNQGVIEQARQVLFGGNLDAKTLVELLFGTSVTSSGIVFGAIKLYKSLKGKKPDKMVIVYDQSTSIVNNNIHVDTKTAQLYANDIIRSKLDGVLRPIGQNGIQTLKVKRGEETLAEVGKEDLPERIIESRRESSEQVLTDTRETLLKVVTANFEKGKWKFSDGNAKFNADIQDVAFRRRLDARDEGFYKGDVLRVKLTTIQSTTPDGGLRTQYVIEEVLEHKHPSEQPRLLPPKKS